MRSGRSSGRRLRAAVALVTALVVVGTPATAWAHGGTDRSGYSNYHSVVTSISPAVPGLDVHTSGVDGAIVLVNRSGHSVVVLGYGAEPYLRIDATGVEANLNSPATYVNGRRDANVPVPDHATSSAVPSWFRISAGDTAHWHDHRTHWMGSIPPDAVRAAPGLRQVIFPAWTIPLTVDGAAVTVTGRLEWVPSPHRSIWLLVSFAGLVLALGLLQLPRRARPVGLALGGLGWVPALLIAISRSTEPRLGVWHRVACYPAALAVLALLAVGLRRPNRDLPVAWGTAGAVLVAIGIAYFGMISYSQVSGTLPDFLDRLCVAVVLSCGGALVVATAVLAGERWSARRSRAVGAAADASPTG